MSVNRSRAALLFLTIFLAFSSTIAAGADKGRSADDRQNKALAAKQLVLKGLSYSLAKNYDKAIDTFTAAIELVPDYARAYDFRGDSYMSKGDIDLAINDYSKAVSFNPDYPDYSDIYHNRGIAYAMKGLNERAIEDFNKAIQLKPDYGAVFAARGSVYMKMSLPEKAAEDFRKACSMSVKKACEDMKTLK